MRRRCISRFTLIVITRNIPYLTVKIPNIITISRVPFLFVIVTLLYWSGHYAATWAWVLFILAGVSDWLDGYVARKYNLTSAFGKLMDALIDKILMIGLFIILLTKHILPEWSIFLVIAILGREFLVTGLRLVAASHGTVLEAERAGKQKTVMQIVATGVLILSYALEHDWNNFTLPQLGAFVHQVGLALFVVATLMTLRSGVLYFTRYKHLLDD